MKTEVEDQTKPSWALAFPPTPHAFSVWWMRAAGALVLVSLIVQHGFPLETSVVRWMNWLMVLLAIFFVAELFLTLRNAPHRKAVLAARRFEFLLLLVFAGLLLSSALLPSSAGMGLAEFLHLESRGALTFNLIKLFLLLNLGIQGMRGVQRLFGKGVRPELVLAGSFATLIVVGAFLLLLPNSSESDVAPIGIVDALFTATSATCVTGLVVRDTGTDFSGFGQMVIFALFQTGGLGIITFVAFLSVFSTRALPVQQMVAFRQVVSAPKLSDLKRQIVGIVLAAGVIELIGAFFLYQFLPAQEDTLTRIKWSVFHSVSAFCNAGFALQSNSLEFFRDNMGLNLTVILLVVLGGLGFLTLSELVGYKLTRAPLFRRLGFFRRLHAGQAPARLSVQTKLAVTVTLVLLAAGTLGFWLLEARHTLEGRGAGEGFLIAAFQSVTTRTAGFNTVTIGNLQDATLVMIMVLMVIGANPVSTGGGIKTVSFGILLLALRSMVTRRERVEAFGRTIPAKTLFAALSVFVIYIVTASLGIFLLAIFDPQLPFQARAFEVFSALSTVGLSLGITAELSAASKIVLCVVMFVGRVGPISLVLSVFQSRRTLTYDFPEEEVVVG